MSPQEKRRRVTLVDRKFQVGLASRLVVALFLFTMLGLVLAFAPSFYLLATTNDPKSLEAAATEFLVLHKRLWPAALICFAGIFLYALRLSHRMAGPIYRINTVLGQLLRDVPPGKITFRENDFFLQTGSLLDQLSEKLRNAPGNPRENAGDDQP